MEERDLLAKYKVKNNNGTWVDLEQFSAEHLRCQVGEIDTYKSKIAYVLGDIFSTAINFQKYLLQEDIEFIEMYKNDVFKYISLMAQYGIERFLKIKKEEEIKMHQQEIDGE